MKKIILLAADCCFRQPPPSVHPGLSADSFTEDEIAKIDALLARNAVPEVAFTDDI